VRSRVLRVIILRYVLPRLGGAREWRLGRLLIGQTERGMWESARRTRVIVPIFMAKGFGDALLD